ncbi:type III-A CRISPR-associated protein Cas10/Csm1, partial [Candidatus Poribacteria bacterium]|nr:type III-A CRISPR-associated protein Cas10/Csm1 [Candidatus Poribacteria bacterium]
MKQTEIGKEIVLQGIEALYEWSDKENNKHLESIFARLSLSYSDIPLAQHFFPPVVFSEEINYPRGSPESFKNMFQQWKTEVNTLREKHNLDNLGKMPIDSLLSILEIFGAFIPASIFSDADVDPDICLYDYIKTKVAVEMCQNLSGDKALIVSGDFSGLQNFIYTTSSKGALKTLRARSFFLELLNEHVIYEILDGMLNRANIIYSGGGGFCIVAPATNDMLERLKKVRCSTNDWLWKNHGGKLYLGMEWREVPIDHLNSEKIADDLVKVQFKLERSKQLKFLKKLRNKELFKCEEPEQPTNEDSCQICHRDDFNNNQMESIPSGERACQLCYRLFNIGENLPRIKYITRGTMDLGKEHSITIGDNTFYSIQTDREFDKSNFETIWAVNNLNVQELLEMNARTILIANKATYHGDLPEKAKEIEKAEEYKKDDSMATFSGLASAACGDNLIGVLRADVDNLGTLVTRSLGKSKNYLMRLSVLSKSLNYFFKLHLNRICEGKDLESKPFRILSEEQKRYVTVVYAGGDDLFIVGAWNHIAELAFDINKAFREYTCHNPDITLSAGMTIHGPKFPIYQMARLSEYAENAAKNNLYKCNRCHDKPDCELLTRDGKCKRKDSLALFFDPILEHERKETEWGNRIKVSLKWKEAEDNIFEMVNMLSNACEKTPTGQYRLEKLPRGFIYKINEIIDMWRREGKLYLPRMAWVMSRAMDKLEQEGKKVLAQNLMLRFYCINELSMSSMHIPIMWIDLLT